MLTAAPVVSPVTLSPMGVSQLLGSSTPSTPRADRTPPAPRATVTELPSDSEHSGSGTPPEFNRKPNGSKRGEVYV